MNQTHTDALNELSKAAYDNAGARGINIGRDVLLKMQYNATRPHMHGKLA